MLRLYDYLPSGNGYKVRLLLTQLGIPFERIELDILKGQTRAPEFLAKFPNGRIPAVELDDSKLLFESNAIITYFAEETPLLPDDKYNRAKVMQWLFFEQYSHEPYIASVRFLVMYPRQRYSIADIALYAYTNVAGEGGFDLSAYSSIRAWLERVRSHSRSTFRSRKAEQ